MQAKGQYGPRGEAPENKFNTSICTKKGSIVREIPLPNDL